MTIPNEQPLRIAILGAGAVGSLVAARLIQAGHTPTLVARGARLRALQTQGLYLRDAAQPVQTLPVSATSAHEAGPHDIVFLALKAHAIAPALPDIARLLMPETRVIPLINGIPWWYFQPDETRAVATVDPDGALARAFDPSRLIGAVLFLTASLDEDGAVVARGPERIVMGSIGRGSAEDDDSLLAPLRQIFADTAIGVRFVREIRRDLWSKVALNLATNPLSVVAQATLAEQFNDPALAPTVAAVLEETVQLARTLGVEPRTDLEGMLAIGHQAGAFRTSMAQDFARGSPLELGAIARSVLDLADTQDVAMPTARTITDICTFLEIRRNAA
ncbi:ketopantoate reductase family protein [Novosphingobium mangrovi (ex Hu et al. 2023)]|uniref:2-dehydropantoate 2-reductase n=1 Tax=Novosphingobium mangrovi (ex Hu et al. 2023) TaxID=2930094 RepID=A0ABT0AG13_9SPHN|nr:2-dehydropantoate 2-reductase [Novosphingobium mangrovi (ex Hu et al. 2023)]MCJ1962130.1 2-dehydropantoate 2-reductase [Novosphingobium mangrovi (ex Hu et al. 2023)]